MAGLVITKFFVLVVSVVFCVGFPRGRAMTDVPPGPMVGGVNEIAKNDPNIVRLSKLVADKLTAGDNKERTVVEVVKAGVQVVSGTLTHLVLKISDGEQTQLYEAKIWEQPWINKTEITDLKPVDGN